ncbi:MAG: hypothetical protein CMO80_05495 [Verrucomicrobiales bacterium]|nr:hypothetical protein [Verrucomicrobiales bacterium]
MDLFDITALQHLSVREIVPAIVTGRKKVEIKGKVPAYHGLEKEEDMSEKDRAAKLAYEAQMKFLTRLRVRLPRMLWTTNRRQGRMRFVSGIRSSVCRRAMT